MIRKWVVMFNELWSNYHNKFWSDQSFVDYDDLVWKVNDKILDNRRFIVTCFHCDHLHYDRVLF